MKIKACTKCREVKELIFFYKNGKESCCKECSKKMNSRYQRPNEDAPRGLKSTAKRREIQAKYRERNREKIRAIQRVYVKNNPSKVLARTRKYQLAKQNATPKWLTKEHYKEMEMFYLTANVLTTLTKVKYEVDHSIPLDGKQVKGLHVPWNLQIIKQFDNRSKHNKY